MKRFAVIGNPVAHSLSPVIHQHFAQQFKLSLTYEKIKGDDLLLEEQITTFFSHCGVGLNITLPYKQRAFVMADQPTERCKLAGAANTLWMKDNRLHADNTDGIGLIRDLTRYMKLQGKNILILGGGGAARGIIYPLLEMSPAILTVVIRRMEQGEELRKEFPQIQVTTLDKPDEQFDLIINATSSSLSGESIILPDALMSHHPFCYDLSYNQKEETSFVAYTRSLGCDSIDGLGMLVEQAAEAFSIWNGVLPKTATILHLLRQVQNDPTDVS